MEATWDIAHWPPVRPAYTRALGTGSGLITENDNTISLSVSVGRERRKRTSEP